MKKLNFFLFGNKRKPSIYACLIFLVVSCLLQSNKSFATEEQLANWQNPSPSFSELNLNLEYLSDIIGKGQLIVQHKPRNIALWTKGQIKNYTDVRFSSAMTIIDAPADTVRKKVMDTEHYSDFMPQIRDSSITLSEKNQFIAHYTQQYNMGIIPIKAKFIWQYRLEDNGDVSFLLHDGDVDAAVGRYEFLPINEKQTLLVLTTWQDISTAKFTYRIMCKANEDVRTSFPAAAAAIIILEYRDAFGEGKTIPEGNLPDAPVIPLLTNNPEHLKTLIKLSHDGTLVLIAEKQWYRDKNNDNKVQGIVFASAVRSIPAKVENAKPLILDMKSMKEFTKEIKEVTITPIENGNHVEAKMKIGLGIFGLSLNFYFDMIKDPDSDDVRLLVNGGGDMYPMLGAYEFSGYQENGKDYTFGVLTQGGSVGDSAPYILRVIAKKLPQFEYIRSIFATLPQIEKQQTWVMNQLQKQEQKPH